MADESIQQPRVIVLGGANGAGKTTVAQALLAETLGVLTFVNADTIAQGLSGFDPTRAAVEASRIMLERLHRLAEQRVDFAFETTLAARTYASWLRSLKQTGYAVQLFYLWLSSADLAVERVALRVRGGGHAIPEMTIRQRYRRSLHNFFVLYKPIATTWQVYDNSLDGPIRCIALGGENRADEIRDAASWQLMMEGRA